MMIKTLLVSLFVFVLVINVSAAADDPMKSLFLFQQQMAEGGNSAAMMKLGEMYEKGEGTPRDLGKAREMYQQAKVKGHPDADTALKRISKQAPRVAPQTQEDPAAQERAQKEAEAKQQAAERERTRQAKLKREKAAQQKAAEKAAKEKARRDALAKQQREETARRAAQQRAAQQKAMQQKKLAQQKAAQEAAARKQAEEQAKQETETKGFKSDPCEGPAARVMSICKK